MTDARADTGELARLLAAADSPYDVPTLDELLAGVAASHRQLGDPDAWMRLVAADPAPALRDALNARLERVLAHADGGLSAGKTATAERLAALRAELDRRGLDGFVIPRADVHQGEFVPPHAQRLAWLTGFTGSAGTAVVLREAAAIFVDGRYTVQARGEVDTDRIAVCYTGETQPADWIAANLGDGRLGHDPWLHTERGVQRLQSAAARAGGQVVATDGNPLDAVWTDQPAPPISAVVPHELAYAGETSAAKRARVARTVAEAGADVGVLTLPDSITWLLNVRASDIEHTPVPLSFAVLHADGAVTWYLDARKLPDATRSALDDAVTIRPMAAFADEVAALAGDGTRLLADPATAPARVLDAIRAAGGEPVTGSDPVRLPKACKTAAELAGSRAAHERDGAALTRFLAWLAREVPERAGGDAPVTELEAAEALTALRKGDPAFRDAAFGTISAAGEHGAIVHYRVSAASNRALGAGELYLCDSGGQYPDGTTDVTRTIAVGQPTEAQRWRYTRVLKGHIALATAVFPEGTTGHQLDPFARRPLWAAGLDYAHGTGHGVGSYLGVHEGPQVISKRASETALKPGMICSNEPGHYLEGADGIRIENLVAVTEVEVPGADQRVLGFETLTLAPYCRALIAPELLTPDEIAWIDAYHTRVRETLTPALDARTAEWLAEETRPLAG
ncbi:Xaa-Pro aminopeptidase [Limimonas halophila]|uniref:Xaa-Pro aminopeptidase n=1 Tax=Limimonas halophila TaxID=1082479 RepID=A0A1G7THU3_9PROT|nr:aminopeptidase P family protein [Limimonas halophila]SDG34219.1 Xaa-Pro aminopeptidase [Limimonas halophila]